MKKIILLTSIFFLSGCVTYGNPVSLQDKINSFRGLPEQNLISNWGIPTKTYSTENGMKYLEYTVSSSGTTVRHGTNDNMYKLPGYCTQYYCPPRQSTVTTNTKWCTVTFVLNKEKIIQGGSYKGNWC